MVGHNKTRKQKVDLLDAFLTIKVYNKLDNLVYSLIFVHIKYCTLWTRSYFLKLVELICHSVS